MAIDLLKNRKVKSFIIIEKGGGFGGTWRDNKFPGCCCDVWSHLYCYSFEQNPDWSRAYPGQEEILVSPSVLVLSLFASCSRFTVCSYSIPLAVAHVSALRLALLTVDLILILLELPYRCGA